MERRAHLHEQLEHPVAVVRQQLDVDEEAAGHLAGRRLLELPHVDVRRRVDHVHLDSHRLQLPLVLPLPQDGRGGGEQRGSGGEELHLPLFGKVSSAASVKRRILRV
jgi:hypothetical protein